MRYLPVTFILIIIHSHLQGQIVDDMDDESKLYAQTKQVNQFFRRFNGEEDQEGNRFYARDKDYRDIRLRRKYLSMLFDYENARVSDELKVDFIKEVTDKDNPRILNFHGADWFAEVRTIFVMNGRQYPFTLFMNLEKAQQGRKWVISKVYAEVFDPYFTRDTTKVGQFLHPLSHELDFMNLRKAFINKDSVNQYAQRSFKPDHLTLFLYEIKKGNLKFKTISEVKFHFFQIDNWYFELSEFNRTGYNTGWLISNLSKATDSEKEAIRKYIYYESN